MSKVVSKSPMEVYFEQRRIALCSLGEAAVYSHAGLRGGAREFLVQDFLRIHLPPALAVGSGQVFGYEWATRSNPQDISRQQDVIIYRHDMPVLRIGDNILFFVESVVATIEVKTEFIPGEMRKVFESVESVRRVRQAETLTFQMGAQEPTGRKTPRRLLSGVFYFRKPTTRTPHMETLNKLRADFTEGPDFLFSAEAGLIVRGDEFDTLFRAPTEVEGTDAVYGGLLDCERQEGAYRRVFSDGQKWRGLQALVLEIAERCQRYSLAYTNLARYA